MKLIQIQTIYNPIRRETTLPENEYQYRSETTQTFPNCIINDFMYLYESMQILLYKYDILLPD